jgi:hypothetical protein
MTGRVYADQVRFVHIVHGVIDTKIDLFSGPRQAV